MNKDAYKHFNELAKYLAERSKEICSDNECTEDHHNCESNAYLDRQGFLIDICVSDYLTSMPFSFVSLPFDGTAEDLAREFEDNGMWEDEDNEYEERDIIERQSNL